MFRLPVLLAVASSIALCQSNRIAADGTSPKTFTYKRIEKINVLADVYKLDGNYPRPVILWLYGGGLIFGSRGALPADEREQLLRAGYVLVAIDYRLGPETKLPEILLDVEDAYCWIREKGPTLFFADPQRVAIVGQSAGAYLALMAGVRVHPSPKAIISFYGYGDIAGEWYSRPSPFFLSEHRVTKKEAFRAVSNRVLSESSVLPRMDFYIYCRQNGRWPQEIAGFDPLRNQRSSMISVRSDLWDPVTHHFSSCTAIKIQMSPIKCRSIDCSRWRVSIICLTYSPTGSRQKVNPLDFKTSKWQPRFETS
jgi:hypothetical protein